MSIRHLVQNHLIEKFLVSSSEIVPKIPVNIVSTGSNWTTVKFVTLSEDDDNHVILFINQFDKHNYKNKKTYKKL